jgi:hypothetical protein
MLSVGLFVEDPAHESYIAPLIERIARDCGLTVAIKSYSARGGAPRVLSEAARFANDIRHGSVRAPHILVLALDGNCKGHTERSKEAMQALGDLASIAVCAIPDPHIERWPTLDSSAFKEVFGRGCESISYKCNQDVYKNHLMNCIRQAGVRPLIGWRGHAQQLAESVSLQTASKQDESFKAFVDDLRNKLRGLSKCNL